MKIRLQHAYDIQIMSSKLQCVYKKNLFDHYAFTLVTDQCTALRLHATVRACSQRKLANQPTASWHSRVQQMASNSIRLTQHVLTTDGRLQCWPCYWPASLMLHFGLIQALGVHCRRLLITVKDNRSVITVYARTRADKQCPTCRLPHSVKQVHLDTLGTLTDLQCRASVTAV